MATIKTTLHAYSFDTSKASQLDAWHALRDSLTRTQPCAMDALADDGPEASAVSYRKAIAALNGKTVELETAHLFDNHAVRKLATMRQKTITLYQFDELPTDQAKDRARAWYREATAGDTFWQESPKDDFKEALSALGFTLGSHRNRDELYWDTNPIGAAFGASWSAEATRLAQPKRLALLADRPATNARLEELRSDRDSPTTVTDTGDKGAASSVWRASNPDEAEELARLEKAFESNAALNGIASRLCKLATDFPDCYGDALASYRGIQSYDFDTGGDVDDGMTKETWEGAADAFESIVQDLAHHFATAINAEYEYQNSDDCVDENIRANEYEFDEDGRRAS